MKKSLLLANILQLPVSGSYLKLPLMDFDGVHKGQTVGFTTSLFPNSVVTFTVITLDFSILKNTVILDQLGDAKAMVVGGGISWIVHKDSTRWRLTEIAKHDAIGPYKTAVQYYHAIWLLYPLE